MEMVKFKGKYTPCVMGKGLYRLIQKFKGPLKDLILMRNGLILEESAILMMLIYLHQNQLIDGEMIQTDELMMETLGDRINAGFYIYHCISINQPITIPMEQACQYGLINEPMNTYQIMRECCPDFNPLKFNISLIKRMILVNLYSYPRICEDPYIEDIEHTHNIIEELPSGEIRITSMGVTHKLPDMARIMKKKHIRAKLLQEYQVIKDMYDVIIKRSDNIYSNE